MTLEDMVHLKKLKANLIDNLLHLYLYPDGSSAARLHAEVLNTLKNIDSYKEVGNHTMYIFLTYHLKHEIMLDVFMGILRKQIPDDISNIVDESVVYIRRFIRQYCRLRDGSSQVDFSLVEGLLYIHNFTPNRREYAC